MKVFLVSSGCYSDWSVEGIFSTREKAQAFIQSVQKISAEKIPCVEDLPSDINDAISEYELDQEAESVFLPKRYLASIFIDSGNVETQRVDAGIFGPRRSRQWIMRGRRAVAYATSTRSAAHALKLAIEARQAFRVRKAGV